MNDMKKIKYLGFTVVGLIIVLLGVVLVEKINKSINLSKVLKETEINNNIDIDYSDKVSNNYNIMSNLVDDSDIFIIKNNKRLSLQDCIKIKSSIRKNTKSDDQYYIMLSLYSVESNFHPYADSFLGAEYGRGLGQVSEVALTQYNWKNGTDIQPYELYDIETNIKVSCWLFSYFKDTYGLDDEGTLMTYNKGFRGYCKDKTDTGYSDKILGYKTKFGNV